MKPKFLILAALLSVLVPFKAVAKPLTVAVIDTGFGWHNKGHEVKLCKYGHKDFSTEGMSSLNYGTVDPVPTDIQGHGTNVAGAINRYAKSKDFCLVIIKFFKDAKENDNGNAFVKALRRAVDLKVDIINISGGGPNFSSAEEKLAVQYLDSGGILIVAAGNEYRNLDLPGNTFYPAMYDSRIIVVGNGVNSQERQPTSNYGSVVKRWEVGVVDMYGNKLEGTSQSTAITTGKMIHERFRETKKTTRQY